MLDDVAVPDVEARQVELRLDPRDLARVGDDRVLEAALPALRQRGPGRPLEQLRGSTTWNCTSWMWIGWASSVKLYISQTSVASRAGFSVIGSSQSSIGSGVASPFTVPSSAARGPTPSRRAESTSLSDTCRVTGGRAQRRERGQLQLVRRRAACRLRPAARPRTSSPGRWCRDRRREVCSGIAAAERLVRAFVDQDRLGADREAGEVDDDVGALGRRHQELVELHRRRQEAALGADLPEGQRRPAGLRASGLVTSFRIRKRELQPLRKRKR